jgi:hypothetical protein
VGFNAANGQNKVCALIPNRRVKGTHPESLNPAAELKTAHPHMSGFGLVEEEKGQRP